MENTTGLDHNLDVLRAKKRFLPEFLEKVWRCEEYGYDECPKEISVAGTEFEKLLMNFQNHVARESMGKPREERLREFYQIIYDRMDRKNPFQLGKIHRGEVEHISKIKESERVYSNLQRNPARAMIHSHPYYESFSSDDIKTFLRNAFQFELSGRINDRLAGLAIEIVSTPGGFYLTFPTKRTRELTKYIDNVWATSGHRLCANFAMPHYWLKNGGNSFILTKY